MAHAVLVPLDGSALGERVLPLARGLARATGRDLLLVRVMPAVDARLYG
jgi:nucleotide-binding universal stress UspA family protein